jgi:uncharacterized membrane protein YkvA (DUF1232 family)
MTRRRQDGDPKTFGVTLKEKLKALRKEISVLYLAYRRDDVPLYAKIVAIIVVGYALSPVDLIPDFIPLLGYVDDAILIPLGILLAVKLIPKEILEECREQAEDIFIKGKPKNWIAGGIIIFIWLMILLGCIYAFLNRD